MPSQHNPKQLYLQLLLLQLVAPMQLLLWL
jgi:hypothetical protein